MAKFIKLGAGWKNKSGKGYSCILEEEIKAGERFLIFDNQHKKEPKQPDIILGRFDDSEDKRQEKRDTWENKPANIPDSQIPF